MEEDTGKTQHVGGGGRIHDASHSLVDYNRAGVPLMEIVSQPDIRSAEQARAYVSELRGVLQAIGVSDVKMEEGSMRVDANVSIRPVGTGGARHQGRGEEHELAAVTGARSTTRSRARSRRWNPVSASSRRRAGWDEAAGSPTGCGREGSNDYRYFPEPDLVPVAPTDEMRAAARAAIPELPADSRLSVTSRVGIARDRRPQLVENPCLAELRRRGGGRGGARQGRRELVHRRDPRVPQRDRALARGAAARPGGSPSSSGSSRTARCRAAWPRTCSTSA